MTPNDLYELETGQWYIPENKNKPTEVIIKPEALDTSKLSEGEGQKTYRPTSFDEYIGQYQAKQRIKTYISGCKIHNEIFPHTFISASAGCGKTVLANILSNMLDKKFVCCTAGDLKSEQQLIDKIIECNEGILFVDECHRISNKIGTFMLPILEEFKVVGKYIKPFTCIFATTHKGNLSENLSALVQRFQLDIELQQYSQEELIAILKKYNEKQYNSISVPDDIYKIISNNARFTPRIARTLLKEYIYTGDWEVVKNNNFIVQEGLTEKDIKVLRYLKENNGCGKNNLAKLLRVEPKTYEFEIEPYLILLELISVGSKRKITVQGKLLLERIK
jgi:Holliday junction DNA helicase RuvB